MASAGNGSSSHVAGELFKMMSGVNMLHVPYRGSPQAVTDLISGQVHVMFDLLPSSIEHIRSGKIRALAVTTAARSELLPEAPMVRDFLPGYEASAAPGIGVPKNTPTEIVNKLNQEINAGLANSVIRERLAGNRRVHLHDLRRAAYAPDRRNVTDKIVVQVLVERCVYVITRGDGQERVAVRRCSHDNFGCDISGGARSVLDDEGLAKPFLQPLAH
jgi:hypothetical protein